MSPRDRSVAGFTMVELLVVVILGALILGAAYQVLAVQERSYRQQGAVIAAQQTMRSALDVLEAELREVSAADGDLVSATSQSLTFRAYRAIGYACNLADVPGQRIVVVQPYGGAPFVTGDSLLYFVERTRNTSDDDSWGRVALGQVDSGTCHARWGGGQGIRLNVPGFDFTNTVLGAPIRSFRSITYDLRQIAGEWVLARKGPSDPSPVALVGPLASAADSGLVFRYFDASGAATTVPTEVARIGIVVRGQAQGTGIPGRTHYRDSLVTQLFLRNN